MRASHTRALVNPTLPYASSLCGAWFDVCPVRIDIPTLLVRLCARKVEEARAAHRVEGVHGPRTLVVVLVA